jgi:hypothetical protein
LSKTEPISKVSEKHDAVVKPIAKKIENSALSVGAMLESLRSEHTPENSQDVPDKTSKVDVKPKKEEIKRKRPEQNNGCPLISVERSGGQRQKSRDRTQEVRSPVFWCRSPERCRLITVVLS